MSTTFEEIMQFHPDNPCVYSEICSHIDNLLPFVGAGLTADVYGCWKDALLALCGKLASSKSRDSIQTQIEDGRYLKAAQLLEERRGQRLLARDLVHYYSAKKLKDNWEVIQGGAIWLLPDLFKCAVLTTNFDEAIETVYPARGFSPYHYLDPMNRNLRSYATKFRNQPSVFKLHGTVVGDMLDCETLVFTESQYNSHYREGGDVSKALQDFVDSRSMLFLGCSLTDGNTIEVIKQSAGKGALHFAIVECAIDEEMRDKRVKELGEFGIRALIYEKGRHESVRIILENLIKYTSLSTPRECTSMPVIQSKPSLTIDTNSIDDIEDVINRINARLIRQRRGHPSFALMNDSPAEELFPHGEAIPNALRFVRSAEAHPISFRKFIQDSWRTSEQEHLLITGHGGVGKTVALLTFATEEGFLPKDVPTVYIPLRDLTRYIEQGTDCIDEYLKHSFSKKEYLTFSNLSFEPWDNSPRVILLLDGYNEIPVNKRSAIDEAMRLWAERAGTQLVTTSRVINVFGTARVSELELLGLSQSIASAYLSELNAPLPSERDSIWRLLKTPLMLRLYANTEAFRRSMSEYPLVSSDNAGHLVWNYLQRELFRCLNQEPRAFSNVDYATALLLTLPYISWKMESSHEYSINHNIIEEYVSDACNYWRQRSKPVHYERIVRDYKKSVSWNGDDFVNTQHFILIEETGLFSWNGEGFSLLHQSFRDCFAAIHLMNVIEASNTTLPSEFIKPISENVNAFLADICNEVTLLKLWEQNRFNIPTNPLSTNNVLRLYHRKHQGNLSALDWSGMDLKDVCLFPYREQGGLSLKLSQEADKFVDTHLYKKCFEPQLRNGSVESVCFSPDGSLLASGSDVGAVRLWDSATGRCLRELPARGERALSVCFSPDGSLLASGSDAGSVRLWNPMTGSCLREILARGEQVRCVSFSSDGSVLASGSDDGAVRLWNPKTGRCLHELSVRGGRVRCVCLSPDDSLLASGSDDGTIRIWYLKTCRIIREISGYGGRVESVCMSPDGTQLASASFDGVVRLWNPMTGRCLNELSTFGERVRCVQFSHDGSLLAIGSDDGAVRLWNPISGQVLSKLVGHSDQVRCVHFSSDGSKLASGSNDGIVYLWDFVKGNCLRELFGKGYWVLSIQFSPSGSMFASGSDDGTVRLWNPETCKLVREITGDGGWIESTCFSPDSSLLASGSSDGAVRLWDPLTGSCLDILSGHSDRVRSICFSPDGTMLASGSLDNTVRIWNSKTHQCLHILAKHRDWVRSVCFSPDGSLLASGSDDGTVRLWNPTTGDCLRKLFEYGEQIRSVCFSPDGSLLASGSNDGTVRLWNPATGDCLRKFPEHTALVRTVCFSPDGSLLASGSDDGTVRLWNPTTGECLHMLTSTIAERALSVCFSPNGTCIAAGFSSGSIRLWNINKSDTGIKDIQFINCIITIFDINIVDLDFSLANIDNEYDREVLRQNGAIVPNFGMAPIDTASLILR